MLATLQVLLENPDEGGICNQVARQPINERCESADCGGKQLPARLQQPMRLPQRLQPILAISQMIKRSKEQNCIGSPIRPVYIARIPHRTARNGLLRLLLRSRQSLLDMVLHRIKQMNFITASSQPESVHARRPTDVEHDCRRARKISLQNIPGAIAFQLSNTTAEALGLLHLPIVIEHLSR